MTHYDKQNPSSIRSLFDTIAPRYDLGNAALSFHLHRLWNRNLVKALAKERPKNCLDLCCGTGEIAKRLMKKLPQSHFHLIDFSAEMLTIAKATISQPHTAFTQADVTQLPLGNAQFDSVSIAYGIRNVASRKQCFAEVYRVLQSGGRLGIAELTRPKNALFCALHKLYLRAFVPIIGKFITSNKEAYNYLCQSIEGFISSDDLAHELEEAGFINVCIHNQTCGIATLIFAQKP